MLAYLLHVVGQALVLVQHLLLQGRELRRGEEVSCAAVLHGGARMLCDFRGHARARRARRRAWEGHEVVSEVCGELGVVLGGVS